MPSTVFMKIFLAGSCLFFLSLVFFTSCQKEIQDPNAGRIEADSIISRIVILDTTTFGAGLDTSQITDFIYDGSGRLSLFHSVYYNVGVSGSGRIDADEEIRYQYAGTDTVPAKLFVKYSNLGTGLIEYDTSYLSYADGIVTRDSFFTDSYYVTAVFNKLANNRYKVYHRTSDGSGGQIIDTSYVNLAFQNGNLVKEIDSLWLSGGTWAVEWMDITYDNKANPFRSLSIPYPAPFFQHNPGNIGIAPLANKSQNNETKETNRIGTVLQLLTYEYGSTGLPKIARDNLGFKYLFFYKLP